MEWRSPWSPVLRPFVAEPPFCYMKYTNACSHDNHGTLRVGFRGSRSAREREMTTAAAQLDRVYEDLSPHIGDVLPQHVETFWRDGFVQVDNFVSPELCDRVVEHFADWTGIRWREWPSDPAEQEEFRLTIQRAQSKPRWFFAIRQDDPWMFNYVTQRKFGEAAAKLLKVPSIKILSETLHAKMPGLSGLSREFPWHQDFPYLPIDRAQAVQTWIALVDVIPDMGPMQHLIGSHRSMPGIRDGFGEDAREVFPELFEQYKPNALHGVPKGGVLFHHAMTWHHSGLNKTDRVRWAMSSYRMSATCRYTGAHNFNTDGLGLVPNQTFDHPNFPTIYSAGV
jgi:ectoine hydroxylase-related dioxygenase (phytanoyl-CoA dioxygenase family)